MILSEQALGESGQVEISQNQQSPAAWADSNTAKEGFRSPDQALTKLYKNVNLHLKSGEAVFQIQKLGADSIGEGPLFPLHFTTLPAVFWISWSKTTVNNKGLQ